MKSFTFPSKSNPGRPPYKTVVADDGKMLCNCPAWTNRKGQNARECTHTKQVAHREGGGVIAHGEFIYLQPVLDGEVISEERSKVPAAAPVAERIAPMLASAMVTPLEGAAFDRQYRRGREVWTMEEKLDGHRCVVVVAGGTVAAHSRGRAGATPNVRQLPAHILAQLRTLPDGTYDGELLVPGGTCSDVTTGQRLMLILFDVLASDGLDTTSWPYHQRRARLLKVLAQLPTTQTAISTVESVPPSWADVLAIWKRGGEGIVLKRLDAQYHPGYRSPDWIKVKRVQPAVLTVTGFAPGKSGPYSRLTCVDAAGAPATIKTLGSALLRQITAAPDTFIGRRVVVAVHGKTPIFDHFADEGRG